MRFADFLRIRLFCCKQDAENLSWLAGSLKVYTSMVTGECRARCSKRPFSKAAASEEARRTLRYVEPLSDARTPLADFFSIRLATYWFCPSVSVNSAHDSSASFLL